MTSDKVGCARLFIQKFLLLLASSAALFCGIAACGGQTETITWQEEVALHDGKSIVVTRSMTLGGTWREIGQSPGESMYNLNFTSPDGRQISWENPGRLRLMILDFLDGVPYLAASPAMVTDYARYKCPDPAYVFFKYDSSWQRIEFKDFPSEFRKTNMVISTKKHGSEMRNRIVPASEIARSNGDLDRDYREIDPNKRSPSDCKVTHILNQKD